MYYRHQNEVGQTGYQKESQKVNSLVGFQGGPRKVVKHAQELERGGGRKFNLPVKVKTNTFKGVTGTKIVNIW